MQCPSCNASLKEGSKFCEHCGSALPRACLVLWACQFSSGSVLFRVRGRPRSKQAVGGAVDRPSSNPTGHSGLLG